MARPIRFPQANKKLTKPADMTEQECGDLHVMTDGQNCTSVWQFSEEEMRILRASGQVQVIVRSGDSQPPMIVLPVEDGTCPEVVVPTNVNGKD